MVFIGHRRILPDSNNSSYAQYADDIYFYVGTPLYSNYSIVLNFNGDRATFFHYTYRIFTSSIQNMLSIRHNYYEEAVTSARYQMRYTANFNGDAYFWTSTWTDTYSEHVTNSYVMEFSPDREVLKYMTFPKDSNPSKKKKPTRTEIYKRVTKEYFMQEKIGRKDDL